MDGCGRGCWLSTAPQRFNCKSTVYNIWWLDRAGRPLSHQYWHLKIYRLLHRRDLLTKQLSGACKHFSTLLHFKTLLPVFDINRELKPEVMSIDKCSNQQGVGTLSSEACELIQAVDSNLLRHPRHPQYEPSTLGWCSICWCCLLPWDLTEISAVTRYATSQYAGKKIKTRYKWINIMRHYLK